VASLSGLTVEALVHEHLAINGFFAEELQRESKGIVNVSYQLSVIVVI
jgi:hypothetical protein